MTKIELSLALRPYYLSRLIRQFMLVELDKDEELAGLILKYRPGFRGFLLFPSFRCNLSRRLLVFYSDTLEKEFVFQMNATFRHFFDLIR